MDTSPHSLLLALDRRVRQLGAFPDVMGSIAVGVGTADADAWWWVGEFDGQIRTSFYDERPEAADAALRLDCAAASSLLERGQLPRTGSQVEFSGQQELFSRFLARYTDNQSPLAFRLGG